VVYGIGSVALLAAHLRSGILNEATPARGNRSRPAAKAPETLPGQPRQWVNAIPPPTITTSLRKGS
jgi:hypothetical protein